MADSPDTSSDPSQAPIRRPWFQFSCRTLLIATALAAVLLAFFGVRWFRDYQERQAVAAIRKVGGVVVDAAGVTLEPGRGKVDRVILQGQRVGDDELASLVPHLKRLWTLRELDLAENRVTDAGLAHLKQLPNLRELVVFETLATDGGLADLRRARPELAIRQARPHPTATRMAMRKIYEHAILKLAYGLGPSPLLASGSANGMLRFWDGAAGELRLATHAHRDWLFSLAFSPDGRLLATGGGDNLIKLWEVETGRHMGDLVGHTGDVHAVAFACAGAVLVSAADDRTLRTWDMATRRQIAVLTGHTASIPGLAVSPDGRTVASASRDDTVRLWDAITGCSLAILRGHTHDVLSVAFGPDACTLASGSYDKTVRLWDVATTRQRRVLRGHRDWVFAVAVAPDGRTVVSGGGDGLRLWDAASGEPRRTFTEQLNVSSLAFSPDARMLASSSAAGDIVLRDAARGGINQVLWAGYQ